MTDRKPLDPTDDSRAFALPLVVALAWMSLAACGSEGGSLVDGSVPWDASALDAAAEDSGRDGGHEDGGDGRTDEDGDGYSRSDGDCDDEDPNVNPGETEVPYNGVDEDCDPSTRDDDLDGDGHRSPSTGGADCDESDPFVYPGAVEIPYDGVDQDCRGGDLVDVDEDGFAAREAEGDDCDDLDPDVNPSAFEDVYDGVDQDCDGLDTVDGSTLLHGGAISVDVVGGSEGFMLAYVGVVHDRFDLWVRGVGRDGSPETPTRLVRATGELTSAVIARTGAGRYVVAWMEALPISDTRQEVRIYAVALQRDGTVTSGPIQPLVSREGDLDLQSGSGVAAIGDGAGHALVHYAIDTPATPSEGFFTLDGNDFVARPFAGACAWSGSSAEPGVHYTAVATGYVATCRSDWTPTRGLPLTIQPLSVTGTAGTRQRAGDGGVPSWYPVRMASAWNGDRLLSSFSPWNDESTLGTHVVLDAGGPRPRRRDLGLSGSSAWLASDAVSVGSSWLVVGLDHRLGVTRRHLSARWVDAEGRASSPMPVYAPGATNHRVGQPVLATSGDEAYLVTIDWGLLRGLLVSP